VGIIALGLATLTVLVGVLVLADVGPTITARKQLGGHVILALLGVGVLATGAFSADRPILAGSLVVLLVAGGLGLRMLLAPRAGPATGVVIVHGIAAGGTLVLVLIAALIR